MNKHIKKYSERLYENIGRGSVVLIKGRPTPNGRRLYATTITGYTEIRPGLVMVFLGDQIYQVLYKEGKFLGSKVDYVGEDGLKGVLNLKNPGAPSLVLNHNKTPYHWMTLKHLDIGSALRELGERLFDHELILESDIFDEEMEPEEEPEFPIMDDEEGKEEREEREEPALSPEAIIAIEFMKLLIGEPSMIFINNVNESGANSYSYEIESDDDDGPGRAIINDYEWLLTYDISINGDLLDNKDLERFAIQYEQDRNGTPLIKYTSFMSQFGTPYDNRKSGLSIDLEFKSDIRTYSIFHRGGYMEPDEWEHCTSDLSHSLDFIYVDGEDMSEIPEMHQYIDKVNNKIKDKELPEVYDKIIGKNLLTRT